MVSPQRTLRYPYNKVQGPPIHSWVDYDGEHHAGMGNGTHNLLIGGHESLPPSQGPWCRGGSTIIPSKFPNANFNVWKITEYYYFCLGVPHNTITSFSDATNIQLWLSKVQRGYYFSRAPIRGMLLQFSKIFLWNKFLSLASVSNSMRNLDAKSPLLL
jgi:hypothetical protein